MRQLVVKNRLSNAENVGELLEVSSLLTGKVPRSAPASRWDYKWKRRGCGGGITDVIPRRVTLHIYIGAIEIDPRKGKGNVEREGIM